MVSTFGAPWSFKIGERYREKEKREKERGGGNLKIYKLQNDTDELVCPCLLHHAEMKADLLSIIREYNSKNR